MKEIFTKSFRKVTKMLQNDVIFYILCFCNNLYQSNNNMRNFDKNNHEKQHLKLNSIKTVYDFGNFTSRRSTYLIFTIKLKI